MAQDGTLCTLPSPGVGNARPFALALRRTQGLGEFLPHRRGEATGSLHTARALGWGAVRYFPHSFPGHPVHPRTLPHPGGRRPLTARSFRELLLRIQGGRLVASTCRHLEQEAKELLSPWAQGHRTDMPSAQTPSSEWSKRPCPGRPLVSPSQPGFHLSAQRAGDTSLTTDPLLLTGLALLLATVSDNKADSFSSPGQRAAPSPDMLLGSAVTDVSLSLRLFPQAQPSISLRQRGCPAKRLSLYAGLLHRAVETSSGKQQPHPTDPPTLISQRVLCFPRGEARAKRHSL